MRAVRTILFILVCVGLIWLLVTLVMGIFSGGNNTEVVEAPALTTYADTNSETQMFIDGPINQNEEHESLKIIVSRDQTQIQVLKGYNGQVVDQRTYPNTENSYEEFLAGLDQLGFSEGIVDNPEPVEQGQCPLGNRTVYSIEEGSDLIGRGWTSSCGKGSFKLNRNQIKTLFIRQIPSADYSEITKELSIV